MWYDNCLLLFPLRGGSLVLAILIAIYSIAGGVFLFLRGELFYFVSYEYEFYGAVSIIVGLFAVLTAFALANSSYLSTRMLFYLGPFILLLCAIRAGVMVYRLNAYQANVIWECSHGGQLYNATFANQTDYTGNGTAGAATMPPGFCSAGFSTIYLAFALALAADLLIQMYSWFLTWRFKSSLESSYFGLSGQKGGIYTA